MTISFEHDLDRDISNRYKTIHETSYGVTWRDRLDQTIVEQIYGKPLDKVRGYIADHIQSLFDQYNIPGSIVQLNERWKINGEQIFHHMEKVVQRSLPVVHLRGYITTIGRCPYNPQKRFFLYYPIWQSKNKNKTPQDSVRTTVHELLHMMVHYYYEKSLKQDYHLTDTQFHDLKEAQTVIINEEFKNIITHPDEGYPSHKDIREYLNTVWLEHKDFDLFVQQGADYMRQRKTLSQ